ncbi:Rod binding domain-containing protein [Rhizomicrobium palustre]|uniref:Rod binding domain-containing protein n=1 Tax=Rhizomicrobium palustre TaxID=189966 RepID=A0A846MYJ6_9PROT|nr:rod-binding protein [Rhizomicrobium palustre]NIK88060.1 Rod binding domain-containing protein [Rhizomicrobium palustre]
MDISAPATTAQLGGAVKAPAATKDTARAQKAAQDFEGVFLTQMLGQMFSGLSTDGPFGGGQGEAMFRSLMLDEYGKQLSKQGGIGLAPHITAELLKHQEASTSGQAAPTQGATP